MAIVQTVLARVFVDDLDAALPAYRALCDAGAEARRFDFHDVRLAWVGPFLLLQAPAERRAAYERVATLLVDDIAAAQKSVVSYGGEVLDGPAPGPNGDRMIARHADGAVFEYIAATTD
jgi:predicted enzyme related to lactoylglutathione lyase